MADQLYKKQNLDKVNLYPKTYTDNIVDNEGRNLTEILQGFNCYFLSYTGNVETTRLQVPKLLRKQGLWITYVDYENNTIIEYYDNPSIEDSAFKDSSNWREGNNRLVGDLSISANGNWVINGIETEYKAKGETGETPLFRYYNNILQASYNKGNNWEDITSFTNNLGIHKYVSTKSELPNSASLGTIYAVGPETDKEGNSYYRLYTYAYDSSNTLKWVDNGLFKGITAGIVNDLTTGGADKALSAEMGKELQYQFFGISRYVASPNTSFNVNVTKGGWRSVPITLSSGIHKILIRRGEISDAYPLYVNIFAGETNVGTVTIPVNIGYAQIQMSSAEPVDRIAFYCGKDEQVMIEIEKSVAELVPSTELQTSISEQGKFFGWSAGKEVATTTKTEILKVDVQGLKNIHALLYNVDIGSASIAFIDANGVFMQDSSVRSVDTKGIPMWFWADVPDGAKTAVLTNRYDTGHTPVVVTIDPTVKSAVEHEIDELKLGKSILYSRAESPVSTSIDFNPLPIDITKYINDILYLDVKELSSTDGFIVILNADGIYLYRADIKSTGIIYFQVPPTASKMQIYKPASNNNILNFEIGKLNGIYPNKGEGYGYMHNINSEVVTADEIKNGMFLGYYSVGQFTGSIVSSAKYWACTPMEFSNGYTVEFDTDWSVYQLEIGIIQPDFVKQSTQKTYAFSLDTTGLIGWCVQIRRKDYKTLTIEEAKSALSLTIVGSKKFERPASIPYVNSKLKNIAEELEVSDVKRNVSSISRQTIDARKYPLLTSKWYHHMFMGSITKDRQSIIPAQSVFDVALASRLGLKVIELNVLVTSDGIPVTGHQVSVDGQAGYLGTLRTLDGTAVNVHIPSTTFAALRSNYVYNSKYPQYRVPITSLEEALRACAEYDIIPLVQIVNDSTYTLVEGIMGKNYIAYNGSRTKTDVMISGYPSGTVDELVAQCEKVGAPYFLCVNLSSINAMTDSEIKELLTRAHALGCMVGHAGNYHSVMENQRYNKLGMDLVASGWDVPDFSESNEKLIVCNSVKGFSDIGKTTGTLSDGETISVQSSQQSIIAKASLHIHYKGTVQISFGRYISNVELTSDGASEVVQTSIIDDTSADLTIKSVGDVEIYSMSYRVASVI